jgi:type II secretory pathway pseudopilin PulG
MIELLVAASITVILAGLMLTVVVSALNSWNRSHGVLEAEAQARQTLDQLASDLQGAIYRNDGNVWLAAAVEDNTATSGGLWRDASNHPKPSSVNLGPGLLADARFGIAGVWLRFVTTRPAATQSATEPVAPVAVAYQLIRRIPNDVSGDAHYLLFRSEVAPSVTFSGGYNLDPAANVAYATTLKQPDKLSFIADNVIDFGVRLYSRGATTGALTPIFPVSNADLTHLASEPPTGADIAKRFPDVADVMIRVLTTEGVRQIQALENNASDGRDWWAIATANSKVFTRRIALNPSPL